MDSDKRRSAYPLALIAGFGRQNPAFDRTVESNPAALCPSLECALSQCEGQLHADPHRDRMAVARARLETPLRDGEERLLIEAEACVERARDTDARRIHRSIGQHDRLHLDDALDLGAHRVAGVVRPDFLDQLRRGHAVARVEHVAAEPSQAAGTQTGAVAGATPRTTPAAARSSAR